MKKGVGIIIGILFGLNIVLVVLMVLMLTGVIEINVNKGNNGISAKNEEKINNNTNRNENISNDDEKYASIIDEYRRAMNDSNYDENMDNYSNINSIAVSYYHMHKKGIYEGNMTINYSYYDINKDGNNEMIVISNNSSMENNILQIYTYDGSKANMFIKEVCLGERCHAYIYENGLIYFYGSSGAAHHNLDFYKISSDGYSKETVKDFGVEIQDGVYNIDSDGVKTEFKSDEEAINSVVGNTKKIDLSSLKWVEIK